MYVVGVDLSGPASPQRTGVAVFEETDAVLRFLARECDGSDCALRKLVASLAAELQVIVGLDAPLSYQPGGGQRARDRDLREQVQRCGRHSGTVMAPTAPRMAYLTLRGISVARVLRDVSTANPVKVVEVHPGAALCFRGATIDDSKAFSRDSGARHRLLDWLEDQGLEGIETPNPCTSHFVAGCAAAVAARDWAAGCPRWLAPAEPPFHPFDFAA